MQKKILLLGSGELGKEFVIAAQRLGQYTIAVDSYDNAPAMQVADEKAVIDMLDGNQLDKVIDRFQPDIIVPEIEAIRTERFYDYEKQGIQVVPSAKAANYTMNRKAIRDLAAQYLGIRTAQYAYATSLEETRTAVEKVGIPCVIKPLMSSSGKGQSLVKTQEEVAAAWEYAFSKGRGDGDEVIVEEFIEFDLEITLLTVTQKDGPTLSCPPIGHRQERGDYMESWQPVHISEAQLEEAQEMAEKMTKELTGSGIWGVEFFIGKEYVYFSELSPRPHDTGMVTLANTQNFNEFELHLRAVLGLPIPKILLQKAGASAVILAKQEGAQPQFEGLQEAAAFEKSDFKLFGKPTTRPYRRMGVALAYDQIGSDIDEIRARAKQVADTITVVETEASVA